MNTNENSQAIDEVSVPDRSSFNSVADRNSTIDSNVDDKSQHSDDNGEDADDDDDSTHTSFSISRTVKPLNVESLRSAQQSNKNQSTGSLTPVNQPTEYFAPEMFNESGSSISRLPIAPISLDNDEQNHENSRFPMSPSRALPPQNLTPEFAASVEHFAGSMTVESPPVLNLAATAVEVPNFEQPLNNMTPEVRGRNFDLDDSFTLDSTTPSAVSSPQKSRD